ncbi:MAG: hypothetical protein R3E10_14185 [Gemmatimonadota bacterium]
MATPLYAQDAHRIWGRVHTKDGEVHEGFIRWDRNEASWVDQLDGTKGVPQEHYDTWLALHGDTDRPTRTIQLRGYRVSWDEEDPDFPLNVTSGLRFGQIAEIVAADEDSVDVVLRSGARIGLSGGSTDFGPSMRELLVESSGRSTELEWEQIERVEFSAAPAGERPPASRLYGTVEDDRGRSFTGFISWDLDEVMTTDILDGRDEGGDDRDIPMGDIRSIEGHRRSSTVTLASGRTLELSGSNDVGRGHRGVQISDPGLGMVEVEWDEFARIEFSAAPAEPGYDAFDGGHRLVGTVTTQAGEEVSGLIRWDMDEESSWELLNGVSEKVSFDIEFGQIARIERGEVFGARVTLLDGRTFELDDSNDVDWDNKGILVTAEDAEGGEAGAPAQRYVSWEEFKEVRFQQHGSGRAETGGR